MARSGRVAYFGPPGGERDTGAQSGRQHAAWRGPAADPDGPYKADWRVMADPLAGASARSGCCIRSRPRQSNTSSSAPNCSPRSLMSRRRPASFRFRPRSPLNAASISRSPPYWYWPRLVRHGCVGASSVRCRRDSRATASSASRRCSWRCSRRCSRRSRRRAATHTRARSNSGAAYNSSHKPPGRIKARASEYLLKVWHTVVCQASVRPETLRERV